MYATVTCKECHTTTTAELGELGPEMDTVPCCGSDTCTKRLCPCCPQVVCYCCGKPSCPEHITHYYHSPHTKRDSEAWCEVCRKK